jgi:hypothetical protein
MEFYGVEMYMLKRNGVDLVKYFESFDSQSLHSIMQFLEVTDLDIDVEGYIRYILTPQGEMEPHPGQPHIKRGRGKTGTEDKPCKSENKKTQGGKPRKIPTRLRKLQEKVENGEPVEKEFVWGKMELPYDLTPLGPCKYCDGIVAMQYVKTCEFELSGRYCYEECQKCQYYAETFVREGKFTKIEGGINHG